MPTWAEGAHYMAFLVWVWPLTLLCFHWDPTQDTLPSLLEELVPLGQAPVSAQVGRCGQGGQRDGGAWDEGRSRAYKYRRVLQVSVRTLGSWGVTWAGLGFPWRGMEVTGENQLKSVWILTTWGECERESA